MSKDTSPVETHQKIDVSGSFTTNFQHSKQLIIREQSGTQVLDAWKLSMVVGLADILSNIKPYKN